jgi:hypothetical protein
VVSGARTINSECHSLLSRKGIRNFQSSVLASFKRKEDAKADLYTRE